MHQCETLTEGMSCPSVYCESSVSSLVSSLSVNMPVCVVGQGNGDLAFVCIVCAHG